METIELAGNYCAQWGEGPIWWQGQLLYVDIERHLVLQYDPSTNEEKTWDLSSSVGRVGTVVPRSRGGLVVAGDTGLHFLDTTTGTTTPITDPETDKPDNRFNDGKC